MYQNIEISSYCQLSLHCCLTRCVTTFSTGIFGAIYNFFYLQHSEKESRRVKVSFLSENSQQCLPHTHLGSSASDSQTNQSHPSHTT